MNNELRAEPEMKLLDLLGQHSDRDLLLILMSQILETKTEVRVLQATVNTLLIELCHRQPDKLSESLTRMSAQRRQELLSHFRTESEAFDRRARGEPKQQLRDMPSPGQSKGLDLLETAPNGPAQVDHAETRQVSHS
jgi:hypothetical protein